MDGTEAREEELLRSKVLTALKDIACCDYRLGVGQLGLIQDVQVSEEGAVSVKVLPCCIFGMNRLVTSVREGLGRIEGITKAEVDVAWDQVWDRMSQEGKGMLQLDLKALAQKHGLKPWGSSSQKP